MAGIATADFEALFGGQDREVSRVVRCGGERSDLGKVCCTIGVFDGIHAGHRRIISDCIASARDRGVPSVIVTFDPDPEELFANGHSRKLMSNQDRIAALARSGADVVVARRFDGEFSHMQPVDFIHELLGEMDPVAIFVGRDFRFGYGAMGDVGLLERELGGPGCKVEGEELLCEGGEPVTATRIRDLIQDGSIEEANSLLGRPFHMVGTVVRGRQVGRQLGYPTANLAPVCDYVHICGGVYIGYVLVHGSWYKASISVGVPKTFGDLPPTIEAHLVDFDEDIYDEEVVVCFTRYLRPMMRFDSTDELAEAISWYTRAAAEQPPEPSLRF